MNSEIVRHHSPEEQERARKRKELATLQPEPASPLAVPFPTLQDAITSNTVTAEFRGNGGSSGDSVMAQLGKGPEAGPKPLEAILPAGSVLVSDDINAQNMMVVGVRGILRGGNKYLPENQIVLTESDAVVYVLAAYCMQFEKENPSHNTRFSLEPPDPLLARIAEKGASLTVPAMQAAVWMHTDDIIYEQMNQKLPITPDDWAAGETVFRECRNAVETNPVDVPKAMVGERGWRSADEQRLTGAQSIRVQHVTSVGGELMGGIAKASRSTPTQVGPHVGFADREDSREKTPRLSEWRIVRHIAESVCQRITRKAIRALQELDNGLQSGDDSGLTNAWEEICVQSQVGESDLWDAYDETVSQTVSAEVAELQQYEREAVWLQTPEGDSWDAEDEDSRDPHPVAEDEIVEHLKDKYIYPAAADWSNRRIRKYLKQSWE